MINVNPKVSIVMITYNHEEYIETAIDSILDQIIDFDVEFIIADDFSSDSTSDIVKDRIEKHVNGHWIKYKKHNKNLGMQSNFVWALSQAKGEFIALCEGDDFWIDKYKLQKQFLYMLNNVDCVICGTNCHKLNFDKIELLNPTKHNVEIFTFKDVITSSTIPTLTYFFRNSIPNYNFILRYKFGDLPLLLELTKRNGKIAKLPFVSGVYRYHGKGANSGSSEFENYMSFMNIKFDFCYRNELKFAKKYLFIYFTQIILGQLKHLFKGRFERFRPKLIIEASFFMIKTLILI